MCRRRKLRPNGGPFSHGKRGHFTNGIYKTAFECLDRLYNLVRIYINFFQPTMKLSGKTRHGARVSKHYDTARTPYQRLLKSNTLIDARKTQLAATYARSKPVLLLTQINGNLQQLWKLADHATSVAGIMKQSADLR